MYERFSTSTLELRPPDAASTVRIRTRADHGSEVELQVLAELEPPVSMGEGDGALDVVRYGLARRIGNVVHGKHGHVIAYADAPVFPPVSKESSVCCHVSTAYQRLVFRLWVWTCSPFLVS